MQADRVLVNSRFTCGKFLEAFPSVSEKPTVLYPGVQIEEDLIKTRDGKKQSVIFSLQRFDRKKRVRFAIEAYSLYKERTPINYAKLVVAGGYDPQVRENKECLCELERLCAKLGLTFQTVFRASKCPDMHSCDVLFLPSIKESAKHELYTKSLFLLFPNNEEHFGLVPVEAQLFGLPVIAVNKGGPRETIIDTETGYLVDDDPKEMADAISKAVKVYEKDQQAYSDMCRHAQEHAKSKFSIDKFGDRLEEILTEFD